MDYRYKPGDRVVVINEIRENEDGTISFDIDIEV